MVCFGKTVKSGAVPVLLIAALLLVLPGCDLSKKTEKRDTSSVVARQTDAQGSAAVVASGKTVKVHYVVTADGKMHESTRGIEPLQFTVGSKQVIPGFERGLLGMKAGEKKSFSVSPDEGYGQVYPNAVRTIPNDQIPPDAKPELGMTIYFNAPDGQEIPGRIVEVRTDAVVADFNYPLAGKTLFYDVEVLEVR